LRFFELLRLFSVVPKAVKFTLDTPSKSAIKYGPRATGTQKHKLVISALKFGIIADFEGVSRASPAG